MCNSNAPRMKHMAHSPCIMILIQLLMRNQFNLCSKTYSPSKNITPNIQHNEENWTPAERTMTFGNKYIKEHLSDGLCTTQYSKICN